MKRKQVLGRKKKLFLYRRIKVRIVKEAPSRVEEFFLSKKRSRTDFILVKITGATSVCLTRLLSIEGQLLQLEYKYTRNRFEAEQIRREKQLRRDSLFTALEPVSYLRYQPYEKLARRYFRSVAL